MRLSNALECIVVLLPLIACGCAHQQLRWNTVRQSRTLTDIYEQQVLDNLAMFVSEPNSLPFFSFPNAGGSNVMDTGAITGVLNWAHGISGLNSGSLTLNGSRNMTESWTLTPIIDPVKLQLMRCAYQQVVSNCGIGEISLHCPDCEKMRNAYLGRGIDPNLEGCKEKYTKRSACPPPSRDDTETRQPAAATEAAPAGASTQPAHNTPDFPGAASTECLCPVCWIGYGCKKCMPKHAKCLKVGNYCGMQVWVLPGAQDELTKLTLNILNYAYNDPTPMRTKNVTWELTNNGCGNTGGDCPCPECTTKPSVDAAKKDAPAANQGKITVAATLPFDEPVVPFCGNNVCRMPAKYNVFERPALQYGNSQPSAIPGAGYLQFQQNQQNLTPASR